ncbi:MAG: hypothetical protein KGI58_00955 [Patescibacteria group bacterium]|nr:hypothetical protein [Patescibacteria group bacterium]
MTQKQKIWLWISLAMFIVPEVLFSFLLSSFLFFFGVSGPYLIGFLINPQFFVDNKDINLLLILIELFGILGLLIFNIRFNKNNSKSILSLILSILLLFTIFIFYVGFSMRHGIGF